MIRKLALIGDLHFNPGNYVNLSRALNLVADIIIKEEVDYVVQLGDLWDFYNISGGQTSIATIINAAETPLHKIASNVISLIILEGNHDKSAKGIQGDFHRSSITLIKHPNIINVSDPQVITINNTVFECLPWSTDDERESLEVLSEKWNGVNKGKFKVLVGHFLLEGSRQNGYEVSSGDFKVSNEQLKAFEFNIVAAGHIHHRQLVYPGLIMQNDLRDAGAPTGFRIVTYDDETLNIISDRFIDIKTPQYFLYDLETSNPEEILSFISQTVDNDFHHYVIRIHSKKQGNIKHPPNVKLDYKPTIETVSRIGIKKEELAKMSVSEMLRFWGKKMEYTEEEIIMGEGILKENNIK